MPNPPGGGSDPGGGLYLGTDDDWFGQKWSGSGGVPQFPGDQKSSPGGSFPAADFLTFLLGGGGGGGGELPWGGMRRRHEFQGAPLERTPMPAAPAGGGFAGLGGHGGFAGGLPHYAQGGSHPGGPAVVGELGPEVVDLPAGSQVHPSDLAEMIMALLSSDAAGGRIGGLLGALKGGIGGGQLPHYAYGTSGASPLAHDGRGNYDPFQRDKSPYNPWNPPPPSTPPSTPGGWQPYVGPADYTPSDILGRGGRAGAFDPMGSQGLANLLNERIMAGSGARERAGQLGADLDSGNDPALRAYARTQARLNTQQDASDASSSALASSASANQDWIRRLYYSQFSPESAQYQSGFDPTAILNLFLPFLGAITK